MDSLNRWIVESMLALKPSIFYENGFEVGASLLGVIGGLIFLLSFVLRIAKEFGSPEPPRWMPVINDFIKSGAMLALYFAAWGMAVTLFNALYELFKEAGSIQKVFNSYGETFHNYKAAIEDTAKSEDSGWSIGELLRGSTDSIGTFFGEMASYLFFTLSTLTVMLTYALTKLFHGLLFALAIIWGGLVWSVRPVVNLVKGWLLLTGLVLVWPLMESLVFLFLDLTISDALMKMIPQAGTDYQFGLVALEVVLGVLNLIMAFVLVAIPVITSRLLANGDFSLELASTLTNSAIATQQTVFGTAAQVSRRAHSMMANRGGSDRLTPTAPPKPGPMSEASTPPPQSSPTSQSPPPAPPHPLRETSYTSPKGPSETGPTRANGQEASSSAQSTGSPSSNPVASGATTAASSRQEGAPPVTVNQSQHRTSANTHSTKQSSGSHNTPSAASVSQTGEPPSVQPTSAATPQQSSSGRSSVNADTALNQPSRSTDEASPKTRSPDSNNTQNTATPRAPTQKKTSDKSGQQARHDALIETLKHRSKTRNR